MTVGNLRKLIANLPDDAGIHPDWDDPPDDDSPGVTLGGFKVGSYKGGGKYLSVLVALAYPEDDH